MVTQLVEDPIHFFLNCPRYAAIRIEFVNNIALISRVTIAELRIDENNCIFEEVHKCIRLSRRFDYLIFLLAIWYLNYYIVSYILLCKFIGYNGSNCVDIIFMFLFYHVGLAYCKIPEIEYVFTIGTLPNRQLFKPNASCLGNVSDCMTMEKQIVKNNCTSYNGTFWNSTCFYKDMVDNTEYDKIANLSAECKPASATDEYFQLVYLSISAILPLEASTPFIFSKCFKTSSNWGLHHWIYTIGRGSNCFMRLSPLTGTKPFAFVHMQTRRFLLDFIHSPKRSL